MRKEYTLLQGELLEMLAEMKPEPVMYLAGGDPMFSSQQDRANAVWEKLGKKLGFDPMSVKPIEGKDMKFFTAEEVAPSTEATQQGEVDQDSDATLDMGSSMKINLFSDLIDRTVHFAIVSDGIAVDDAVKALTTSLATLVIGASPPGDAMIQNAKEVTEALFNAVERHASGKCSCGGDHDADHHDA